MTSIDETEKLLARLQAAVRGDESLWRYPLAEAVIDLLEAGEPITADSLIDRLKNNSERENPLLRGAQLDAAIERLQKFSSKVGEEER